MVTEGDRVVGIDGMKRKDELPKSEAKYNFIKLDPLVYSGFLSKCWVEKKLDLILRVNQEESYSDAFPRQIYELRIPNGDLSQENQNLFAINGSQKLIDIELWKN